MYLLQFSAAHESRIMEWWRVLLLLHTALIKYIRDCQISNPCEEESEGETTEICRKMTPSYSNSTFYTVAVAFQQNRYVVSYIQLRP